MRSFVDEFLFFIALSQPVAAATNSRLGWRLRLSLGMAMAPMKRPRVKSIPCRNGFVCTTSDCKYSHPTVRPPSLFAFASSLSLREAGAETCPRSHNTTELFLTSPARAWGTRAGSVQVRPRLCPGRLVFVFARTALSLWLKGNLSNSPQTTGGLLSAKFKSSW